MALAGGTFPSALPPHCMRGHAWQCQKSSAAGDRNTLHGRHQETALTQHPAPTQGAEKMQRSNISSDHAKPPGPPHRHLPMP